MLFGFIVSGGCGHGASESPNDDATIQALWRIIDYSVSSEDVGAHRGDYSLESLDADVEVLKKAYETDPAGSRDLLATAAEVLQHVVYTDFAAETQPTRPDELRKRGERLADLLGADRPRPPSSG